jgi:3-hydroxyisobutyrate dehydrogenase
MRVGIVGLGLMGEPIARRVLEAGHELTAFNRTAARTHALAADGARVAASPADVWSHAEACITMIADDEALRAVTLGDDGLLATSHPGRILIDMSTVSLKVSGEIAARAEEQGVAFLRAPVTGNPSVVRAGNLGIMVSGPKDALQKVEPLLREIGPNVFYLGAGDEARVMKLALNLMIAGTTELIAEALVLGEGLGLERAAMLEVMGASAVGSPFVKYKTAALVAADYTTTFSAAAMVKDLALVLGAAGEAGVPLPVTEQVSGLFEECVGSGMGDLDLTALLPRLRRQAGLDRST